LWRSKGEWRFDWFARRLYEIMLPLILCESRSTAEYYIKRNQEPGKTQAPAKDSVQHIPLVNPMKIFLLSLHMKLELIKCLVKDMAKINSKGTQYLSKKIPNINIAKLKKGIYVGHQIREIMGSLIDLARSGLGKLKVGLFHLLRWKEISRFQLRYPDTTECI